MTTREFFQDTDSCLTLPFCHVQCDMYLYKRNVTIIDRCMPLLPNNFISIQFSGKVANHNIIMGIK